MTTPPSSMCAKSRSDGAVAKLPTISSVRVARAVLFLRHIAHERRVLTVITAALIPMCVHLSHRIVLPRTVCRSRIRHAGTEFEIALEKPLRLKASGALTSQVEDKYAQHAKCDVSRVILALLLYLYTRYAQCGNLSNSHPRVFHLLQYFSYNFS